MVPLPADVLPVVQTELVVGLLVGVNVLGVLAPPLGGERLHAPVGARAHGKVCRQAVSATYRKNGVPIHRPSQSEKVHFAAVVELPGEDKPAGVRQWARREHVPLYHRVLDLS